METGGTITLASHEKKKIFIHFFDGKRTPVSLKRSGQESLKGQNAVNLILNMEKLKYLIKQHYYGNWRYYHFSKSRKKKNFHTFFDGKRTPVSLKRSGQESLKGQNAVNLILNMEKLKYLIKQHYYGK
jgi:hypothetical protein